MEEGRFWCLEAMSVSLRCSRASPLITRGEFLSRFFFFFFFLLKGI